LALIIAGKVYVDPAERDRFVEGHRNIVEEARKAPGCIDVAISPDPTEAGRVNIFEYWESQETLDAWRAVSPPPSVDIQISDDHALKHLIASSGPPFD
jgi:quinol monooxygenase YgiN